MSSDNFFTRFITKTKEKAQNFADYKTSTFTLIIGIILVFSGSINYNLANKKGDKAFSGGKSYSLASIIIGSLIILMALILFYQSYTNSKIFKTVNPTINTVNNSSNSTSVTINPLNSSTIETITPSLSPTPSTKDIQRYQQGLGYCKPNTIINNPDWEECKNPKTLQVYYYDPKTNEVRLNPWDITDPNYVTDPQLTQLHFQAVQDSGLNIFNE